jgi:hypothetical protein
MPVKFSEFANGGALKDGDIIVGLGAGNTRWSFTGGGAGGVTWNAIDADVTMESDNGYAVNSAALVILTVPAVIALGDTFEIANMNTGGWLINLNAGQTASLGDVDSSVAGTLASTANGDCIRLVAVSATDLVILSVVGNIDLL